MKAKVIATGEVVNVLLTAKQSEDCVANVYQEIGTTKNCSVRRKFLDSELEFIETTYTQPKKIDWEQRRFELVKAAMQGLLSCPDVDGTPDDISEWSITQADALIEKLKE